MGESIQSVWWRYPQWRSAVAVFWHLLVYIDICCILLVFIGVYWLLLLSVGVCCWMSFGWIHSFSMVKMSVVDRAVCSWWSLLVYIAVCWELSVSVMLLHKLTKAILHVWIRSVSTVDISAVDETVCCSPLVSVAVCFCCRVYIDCCLLLSIGVCCICWYLLLSICGYWWVLLSVGLLHTLAKRGSIAQRIPMALICNVVINCLSTHIFNGYQW